MTFGPSMIRTSRIDLRSLVIMLCAFTLAINRDGSFITILAPLVVIEITWIIASPVDQLAVAQELAFPSLP